MKKIELGTCLQLLKEEIVPALGCTEPGAVALAAACAKEALGCSFQHMDIQVSGNMLKNVKSVSIPNTGGLRGFSRQETGGVKHTDQRRDRPGARPAGGERPLYAVSG